MVSLPCPACWLQSQIELDVKMQLHHEIIEIQTDAELGIYDLTPQIRDRLAQIPIVNGQVFIFSRHTTTALAINENESRLLEDLKTFLRQLVPPDAKYLHNDLHLRIVPPDEPENAHAHIAAILLHNSETIPIVDGKLGLGTWQSILFFELDGPRNRTIYLQFWGMDQS